MDLDWKLFAAFTGWSFAAFQFILTYRESKDKNESDLLEKTLNYFNQGTQARIIGISLIDGIWWKRKKNLNIILPVLTSQILYLLTKASHSEQEARNVIRILHLIHKIIPYTDGYEIAEISEALMSGAMKKKSGVVMSNITLRLWYAKFTNGDLEGWDAEMENP